MLKACKNGHAFSHYLAALFGECHSHWEQTFTKGQCARTGEEISHVALKQVVRVHFQRELVREPQDNFKINRIKMNKAHTCMGKHANLEYKCCTSEFWTCEEDVRHQCNTQLFVCRKCKHLSMWNILISFLNINDPQTLKVIIGKTGMLERYIACCQWMLPPLMYVVWWMNVRCMSRGTIRGFLVWMSAAAVIYTPMLAQRLMGSCVFSSAGFVISFLTAKQRPINQLQKPDQWLNRGEHYLLPLRINEEDLTFSRLRVHM